MVKRFFIRILYRT